MQDVLSAFSWVCLTPHEKADFFAHTDRLLMWGDQGERIMNRSKLTTRCDLPENTRNSMTQLLNERLADSIQAGLHARQAHWNVRGPGFIALHKLFDEVYEALDGFTDEIAERLTALGGAADGSLSGIRSRTELPEYPYQIASGPEHIDALADSLSAFAKLCRDAIDTADEAGDMVTADLFTGVVREVDKLRWFVEAHEAPGGQARLAETEGNLHQAAH
jgi:starvation-inducible DNA-binding protein